MQEIIDFLHCTVYYTVQSTVYFVLWNKSNMFYFLTLQFTLCFKEPTQTEAGWQNIGWLQPTSAVEKPWLVRGKNTT